MKLTKQTRLKKRFNGIFVAQSEATVSHTDGEVAETQWIAPEKLSDWMHDRPDDFTQGFRDAFHFLVAQR